MGETQAEKDATTVFDALYRDYLLRDFFAKIVPGGCLIYAADLRGCLCYGADHDTTERWCPDRSFRSWAFLDDRLRRSAGRRNTSNPQASPDEVQSPGRSIQA